MSFIPAWHASLNEGIRSLDKDELSKQQIMIDLDVEYQIAIVGSCGRYH